MDGQDCPEHLRQLRAAIDAKIQVIRARLARKRARARKQREESARSEGANKPTTATHAAARPVVSEGAATTSETTTTTTSTTPYGSPDGVLSMSAASADDGDCPLERMPSFAPELIWEMLNF